MIQLEILQLARLLDTYDISTVMSWRWQIFWVSQNERLGQVSANRATLSNPYGGISGMVQASVGQKLLKRNIFKSFLRDRFRVCDATFRYMMLNRNRLLFQ